MSILRREDDLRAQNKVKTESDGMSQMPEKAGYDAIVSCASCDWRCVSCPEARRSPETVQAQPELVPAITLLGAVRAEMTGNSLPVLPEQ